MLDGARLVQERSCLRCHVWEGVQVLEEGPSLDHAGDKLNPGWIDSFLRDPSASRMPVIVGLDDDKRVELVAFLGGMRRVDPFPEAPAGDGSRGAELWSRLECAKCHGPSRPDLALDDVAGKLRRDWLVAFLQDPTSAQPGALMPSFDLSEQDAADLATYLIGDDRSAHADGRPSGITTFVELQCVSCHPLNRFRGTDMKPLLAGSRSFGPHVVGSAEVPRIGLELNELRAMRHALNEWMAAPGTGAAELPAATTRDYWRRPVPSQGEPPSSWTGLERSLHPAACGTCHPRQHYDWKGTIHARAFSYGFIADTLFTDDGSCLGCHSPLTEQYEDPILRTTAINCATCHVRSHVRHAPPLVENDLLDPRRTGAHGGAVRQEFFESSDFCKRCHQFRPGESVMLERGLLMTTFDEWEQSPAAAEGKTCQTCHMPDRRHLWRGIHDPEIVREYLDVRVDGRRILLTNHAGHKTPTYTIPRITVSAWLERRGGHEVDGSRREWIIQRKVRLKGDGQDRDLFDTRLAPGEERIYEYDSDVSGETLVVSVDVDPDEHYQWLYDTRLANDPLTEEMERYFRLAADYPLAEPYNVAVVRTRLD